MATQTFSYTGSTQTYTVGTGVTSLNVSLWGGGGGGGRFEASYNGGTGGNAAMLTGTLAVTPGQVLTVIVAGGGGEGKSDDYGSGGYSGGGRGGLLRGGGGGGCTIIQRNSTNLVMVAGGGGGGIIKDGTGSGGSGGIINGINGQVANNQNVVGGGGGQTTGGTGSNAGSSGQGGDGVGQHAGGGGGGYFGGGGAGIACGGGGGSSLTSNLTNVTGYIGLVGAPNYSQPAGVGEGGVSAQPGGNGYVIITVNVPVSNICFPWCTPIQTDQGEFNIDQINSTHTIDSYPVVAVTKTTLHDPYVVCFEPHSISQDYPVQQTIMTINHAVWHHGVLRKAITFVNDDTIHLLPYEGELMYNVLLPIHHRMSVNGLECETLHPDHAVAMFYSILSEYSTEQREQVYPALLDICQTQLDKEALQLRF